MRFSEKMFYFGFGLSLTSFLVHPLMALVGVGVMGISAVKADKA